MKTTTTRTTKTRKYGISVLVIVVVLFTLVTNINIPPAAATTDTIGGTDFTSTNLNKITGYALTPSASGTLTTLGINIQSAAGNIRLAMYSTLDATPKFSGLLGESASTAAVNGWNDLSIGAVTITAGITVYVTVNCDSASNNIYRGGATVTRYQVAYTYGAYPDPTGTLSTGSTTTWNFRIIYAASTTTTTTTGTAVVSTSLFNTITTTATGTGTTTSKGTATTTTQQITVSTLLSTFTGGTSTIGSITTNTTSATTIIIVQITYTEQRTVTVNTTYTEQNSIIIFILTKIGQVLGVSYTTISKILGADKGNIFAVSGVDPPVERTKQIHTQSVTAPPPNPAPTLVALKQERGSWVAVFSCAIAILIGTIVLSRKRRKLASLTLTI